MDTGGIPRGLTCQERRTASAGVWHGLVRSDEFGEHALLALEEPVGGVVAADAGGNIGAVLEDLLGHGTVCLALRRKRESLDCFSSGLVITHTSDGPGEGEVDHLSGGKRFRSECEVECQDWSLLQRPVSR